MLLSFISLLLVTACVSGKPEAPTLVDLSGKTVAIPNAAAECKQACERNFTTCSESYGAQNTGANIPDGMFGGSADCRSNLKTCLSDCKKR